MKEKKVRDDDQKSQDDDQKSQVLDGIDLTDIASLCPESFQSSQFDDHEADAVNICIISNLYFVSKLYNSRLHRLIS